MAHFDEVIARAEQLAIGRKTESSKSPVIDATMSAEQLYMPSVRYVIAKLLKNGSDMLQDLVQAVALNCVAGTGSLPETVVKEALEYASFPGRKFVSVVSTADFERSSLNNLSDYFAAKKDTFLYKRIGVGSYTGTVNALFVICPAKPASAAADVGLSARVVEDLVLTIAGALTGEIPLPELMNNGIKI